METKNYGLKLTSQSGDGLSFADWRMMMNGYDNDSNMEMVDYVLGQKGDNLVFDNEEGLLYLTSGGERIGDGVKVAAGGGPGGGGGANNNAVLSVANTSGWLVKTLAYGASCPVYFEWSSLEAGISTGPGVLKLKINSSVKATMEIQQGEQVLDIWTWLDPGRNDVEMNFTDVYGNSRSVKFTVKYIKLTLDSDFNSVLPCRGNDLFRYTPTGLYQKTIHFIMDGEEIYTDIVNSSNTPIDYFIPAQSHGAHTFEVYFDANIEGVLVPSNRLKYRIICLEDGNMEPIVAISFWDTTVEQFALINLPYVVYDPANSTASITQSVNGNPRPSLSVGRTKQLWGYRPEESGPIELAITCGDVTESVNINVSANSMDVEAESNALALYLNTYGRSNSEDNPGTWVSGDIESKFTSFNFVSDGWLQDESGATVLRVGGQARLEIPYKLFRDDASTTGKTIEIEFTARDVMNYEAPIITCWSGDRGLHITSQKAVLRSQQSSVFAQYKEDERVRLAFVITRTTSHRMLQIYINGIMSGAVQYPTNDNFSQLDPVNISIGSSDATVDLYCIRVYNMDLNRQQVLKNWIADTPNLTEKAERFQRNNIFDEYGQIVIANLPEDLPYMVLVAPSLPQYKGNKVDVHGSYTDLVYGSKSFTFNGAQADVQGTSSAGYARKNYKIKFKGGFTKGGIPTDNYQLGNSIPTDTFTFKADVASSEGANNVELVKLYNDICPYKTPPQLQDSRVRQGIDGYPIVIFHDDGSKVTFVGKYNFNHDKGTPEVFGLDDNDESWETRNNAGAYSLWKNADFSNAEWKEDFEARHPEDNTNTANLQAVAEWVVSTDTEQATGETLSEAKTYGGVTYTSDTTEYRLAKFDAELGDWFNEESTIFYYLFTEFFLLTDSRAKNSFPTLYDNGKWCWLPYDMDTALGINNMGALTFGYSLEDIDLEGGVPVFNGQNSVLWKNLRATRYEDIKNMYRQLKNSGALTYEDVVERFENHQSKWPEAIFNEDAYYKYIQPTLEGGAYLDMLQGSKSTQRKWWLYNRFQYMDSKYGYQVDSETATNADRSHAIQVRGYNKATIDVTLYADAYATVDFGGAPLTQRAKRGEVHSFECPKENPSELETYFYPSAQVADVGDLSDYYVGWADFKDGVRLQRIKLGAETDKDGNPYRNERLKTLTLGNSPLLKVLDLTNCVGLGTGNQGSIDISGCTNIEEIYLSGTSLSGVTLPNGGVIKKLHLPGTLANLTIKNHPLLTEFTVDAPVLTSDGKLPIEELVLENAGPAIPILDLLACTRDKAYLRLLGLNLTLNNGDELDSLKARLDKMQGKDEYGNNVDRPQLSGDIWVEHLLEYQLEEFQAAYPELTVHFNKYSVFTVNYYNGDKLMQTVRNIAYGATPTYTSVVPTMPGVSDPENYTFVGWYPVPQFMESDMNVSAVFRDNKSIPVGIITRTLSGEYTNDRITKLCDYALEKTQITGAVLPNVTSAGLLALSKCPNLLYVKAPQMISYEYSFAGSPKLEKVDIYDCAWGDFQSCSSLTAVILRKPDSVSRELGGSLTFTGTPIENGGGYIYVPASLFAAYETKYPTFVGKFRTIEDYPEITGW